MIFAMNMPTFVTLVIVLALLFFAIRHIYNSIKKEKTGCSGCSGCAGCAGSSSCGIYSPILPKNEEKDAEKRD